MKILIKLSGVFIFLSVILTLYSYFIESKYLVYAGLLLWFSFFILFSTLRSKKMIISLFVLSLISFNISYANNYDINLKKIFIINQYLITLLISVSFLRLVLIPIKNKYTLSLKGKKSFFITYFSVYFFSSVINISSLILIADKLYKKSSLSNLQIILLTRAFASNAYWSPFFVSFAAASTYAPNLNTSIIMVNGIIFSFIVFLLTYYEVMKNKSMNIDEFIGYPLSLNNLILPTLLVFLVLLTSHFYKDAKVIILISLFSLVLSIGFSMLFDGFVKMIKNHKTHILEELPNMKGEISLFLVAGMFGVSIGSILVGLDISLPFGVFDWIGASFLLFILILLGFIGIHPIITISIIADYISQVNNTLFAITFLMAWATTISTSPFSGVNLTFMSRYNVKGSRVFKLNVMYAFKVYILSVIALYIVSNYLGI